MRGQRRNGLFKNQQVLNPTPLNPTPATCHKRKRKLRCSFRNAALQKLHCNIGFSAVRKSFGPEAALQQTKNCTATSKKLRCTKVALSCGFQAPTFRHPPLGPAAKKKTLLDDRFPARRRLRSFGDLCKETTQDFVH